MAVKIEIREAMREKMKAAPEIAKEKQTESKQDTVKELKREIEAMQKRGYTLADIAAFMTEGGIQITTPTLKSYLQRSKQAKVKTQSKETKQPAVVASAKTAAAAKPIVEKATDSNSNFVKPDSDEI
jgi:DNA-binding transcriptional MerR regulator